MVVYGSNPPEQIFAFSTHGIETNLIQLDSCKIAVFTAKNLGALPENLQ